ncbi:MAG: hypothetical protein VB092_03420 [Oscillospiraceae bacterium]|nr:hypothetical protein [Oscillospiraceae bacterium]
MKYCKVCHRIIPQGQKTCPYCAKKEDKPVKTPEIPGDFALRHTGSVEDQLMESLGAHRVDPEQTAPEKRGDKAPEKPTPAAAKQSADKNAAHTADEDKSGADASADSGATAEPEHPAAPTQQPEKKPRRDAPRAGASAAAALKQAAPAISEREKEKLSQIFNMDPQDVGVAAFSSLEEEPEAQENTEPSARRGLFSRTGRSHKTDQTAKTKPAAAEAQPEDGLPAAVSDVPDAPQKASADAAGEKKEAAAEKTAGARKDARTAQPPAESPEKPAQEPEDNCAQTDAIDQLIDAAEAARAAETQAASEAPAGALERELAALGPQEGKEERVCGKWLLTLGVLVAAAAVALGVWWLRGSSRQTKTDGVLFGYLQGCWLSEEFSYADDESLTCRELLQVNEDGSYVLPCLITDRSNPQGSLDGSLQLDYELRGLLSFADNGGIIMSAQKDGKDCQYVRYLINATDKTMTMREFYNSAYTDYYDTVFTKIEPVPLAGEAQDAAPDAADDAAQGTDAA